MGFKPRPPKRFDVLVTLENPTEECGVYEIVILGVESHEEALEQAREELGGEHWNFWGTSTVELCDGCGGYRQRVSPRGSGAVGKVRLG